LPYNKEKCGFHERLNGCLLRCRFVFHCVNVASLSPLSTNVKNTETLYMYEYMSPITSSVFKNKIIIDIWKLTDIWKAWLAHCGWRGFRRQGKKLECTKQNITLNYAEKYLSTSQSFNT
jgi:hypothetical protein